jgi:tRNA(adenine34) deaminase
MMRVALREAREAADAGEAPVGAALFHGEHLIATAHNNREGSKDPTGHAEILVLREAARLLGDWRLNECTLAVTLEPCVMCAGAIVNARVSRLIYGATDPKAGAVESLYEICNDPRLNHRPEIVKGILAEETGKLLTDFFRQKRERRDE